MRKLIPFALALVLAAPATALAQEEGEAYERGQLYQISTWNVDPADAMTWEAAIKELVEAAGKANIPHRWGFWQDGSAYTLVYPVDAYAYWDNPMQFVQSFAGTEGEAQMQGAMAKFQGIRSETVAEEIFEMKDDWSYMVEGFDMETMKYGHMDVMWIKSGMDEEFEALNKEWVSFFSDLGYPYPYHAHEVQFGDTDRAVYVTFVDELSDYYGKNSLEKMVEAKNMGERWEKLGQQMGGNAMWRGDLSYWPMPGATN
jgi:hypothetical protein